MSRLPQFAAVIAASLPDLLEAAREDLQDLEDRLDPKYWDVRIDNNDASDCGDTSVNWE